jgi:hypothetical protein
MSCNLTVAGIVNAVLHVRKIIKIRYLGAPEYITIVSYLISRHAAFAKLHIFILLSRFKTIIL